MELNKKELTEIIQTVVNATIKGLEDKGYIGGKSEAAKPKQEKTAYQKTEQLLYNYVGFKKIVDERKAEIEDIRKYGVPKRGDAVVKYGGSVGTVQGIVLDEERVEAAVRNVEASVQGTVQAIALIDKCMEALKTDPYYKILEMRYFEGRTQEDIALEFKCTQQAVSYNKSRLVKELSMRLFPDQVIEEYIH